MAKVSLRIYNREIEGLVDQGHTDEAVAHCHHILKTFPKHLETYRLLGKAHLEAKRYNEAVDIFSRALMAVPEDFVSHVGMSIIRDEQHKFDDAIWHMERAFESQPSNAAIQGELQRLYGRRDGMDPPKIRMTRGALAFMYVQGELYSQAIAEIRAVLSEDPNRSDMQVLLARAYFRSGQKADASDMCARLLKQYPYCFDANRIMVELLPATAGAAESTQVYRTRVIELDPYAAFAKGSVFQSNEVADAAISLERLEYTGNEVPMGQDWGSALGIGLADSSVAANSSFDDQPDWLKSGGAAELPLHASPVSASASEPNESIPDFLRAAGWGESNSPEQPTSIFDQEPAGADALVPADLPDWLKAQAPSAESTQPTQTQPASAQSIDTPDWLSGLGDEPAAESAPTQSDDIKDLGGLDDAQEVKVVPIQASDIPDWLGGLGDENPPEPAIAQSADVPDWLSELDNSKASDAPLAAQSSDIPDWLGGLGDIKPPQSSDVPDWLTGLDEEKVSEPAAAQPGNVPEWLAGLDEEKASEPAPAQPGNVPEWLAGLDEEKVSEPAPAQPGNVPEWLAGLDEEKASEPAPAQPGNVPEWLSGLEAEKASEPESVQANNIPEWLDGLDDLQAIAPVSAKSDDTSDWLSDLDSQNQPAQAAQTEFSVDSLGASAQEQDDAVAWLESLAVKHGAKPEELVTDPNKRSDTPPEWVQQAQNINQQTSAQPSVQSLGASAQEQDDAVAWLESLAAKHGAKPEELVTDPNKRSDTPPEWVQQARAAGEAESAANAQKEEEARSSQQAEHPEQVEGALNIGEQFFAEFESSSSGVPVPDETGMWLRSLDEKEKQEEFITPSADESKDAPERVSDLQPQPEQSEEHDQQHAEIPEWIKGIQQSSDIADQFELEKEETPAQNSDLPNWLSGIEEDSAVKEAINEQSLTNQDLSNWLSGLDDEPGLPFDTMPTPNSILANAMPRPNIPEQPLNEEPVTAKSDLPAWLSDVDSKQEEDLEEDLWKKSIEPEAAAPASVPIEESAPVIPTNDLPEWLQGVEAESTQVADAGLEDDDAPPWMHREKWEAEEPIQPMRTSPSDWHPVDVKETVPELAQKEEQLSDEIREPIMPLPFAAQEFEPSAPPKKKSGLSVRQPQPDVQNTAEVLTQAKGELDRGDIPTALNHYGKLIKKGRHLEEAIRDLNESLYRYPVEVGIWQTLGDAYMRSNRLKEALEAYNKAEELIR